MDGGEGRIDAPILIVGDTSQYSTMMIEGVEETLRSGNLQK